jgi:hypothetical protein
LIAVEDVACFDHAEVVVFAAINSACNAIKLLGDYSRSYFLLPAGAPEASRRLSGWLGSRLFSAFNAACPVGRPANTSDEAESPVLSQ